MDTKRDMGREQSRRSLKGRLCYGGLDLAAGVDFNAKCLIFPKIGVLTKEVWKEKVWRCGLEIKEEPTWDTLPIHGVLWRYWIPERKVKEKEDRVDYRRWADMGYIKICPGNVVDHDQVSEDIYQDSIDFNIHSIAYDTRLANVSAVIKNLSDKGVVCNPFGQGIMSVSEPTKELERLINNFQFEHFRDPVIAWMMRNAVPKRDAVGNIRLDKEASIEKIDGVAAMVNATAQAMTFQWSIEGDSDAIIQSW